MFDSILSVLISYLFSILLNINANKKTVYPSKLFSEKILSELMEYLETLNFPLESFDLQCPISKYFASYAENMTPDLTVINPETMQPLAYFRTYDSVDSFLDDNLYDEAYHFNKHTNELSLHPYYVVIKQDSDLQFYNLLTLIKHGKKLNPEIAVSEPIKYKILCSNDYYQTAHSQIIDRNKLQRFGKIAFSIVVPIIAIIFLILDGLKIYKLTELRLVVFGIIMVSILIPYLAQITIKDCSLTFRNKSDENDS